MFNLFFYIIIGAVLFSFIKDFILNLLNLKNLQDEPPDKLKDIYDPQQYRKSQLYTKTNIKFSLFTDTIFFIITLVLLFTGFFGFLDKFIRQFSSNELIISLLYFGVLFTGKFIFDIPFNYYDTFHIEEQFGFNKSTKKLFFTDLIKSYLLGILIGGFILGIIIWFYLKLGKNFWIYAFGIILIYSLFWQIFYINLIIPLFNKLTPLPEGSLKEKIKEFAQKVNFLVKDIKIIDASKRSKKANAYFTGIGQKKTIVLYDTLIEKLSEEETVAVLAHEIGHFKKKHTLLLYIISVLITAAELYLLSFFIDNQDLTYALGAEKNSFHITVLGFMFVFGPIATILGIIINFISRKFEFQADRFAAENYNAEFLISALKKLTKQNLSNLTPHKTYVFFYYSHPTLLERINKLEKFVNTVNSSK